MATLERLRAGLLVATVCGSFLAMSHGQSAPSKLLVGITPNLLPEKTEEKDSLSRDSLMKFIKNETALDNVVETVPNYQALGEEMEAGKKQIGVFSGVEFAWAKERYPELRPLALAINEFPQRYVHVVTRRDHPAKDFAGLAGQSLVLPRSDPGYARLFAERQSLAQGKSAKEFFSTLSEAASQETALDDVVEGLTQAAVVDRVALAAYKRRKPGRFNQLKEVAQSPGFPSPVVAYKEGGLDKETLQRLQQGLVNAKNKQDGKAMLSLSRLTGFSPPTAEFERQLSEVRQSYPAPPAAK